MKVLTPAIAASLIFAVTADLLPQAALARESADAPPREQTLDQDLAGPSVEWLAIIGESFRDGDDTCFTARRILDERGYPAASSAQFITCPFGYYDPATYASGREIRVKGNLGKATPRLMGGKIYDLPIIVGASVALLDRVPYYYEPWGYGYWGTYPCDPFWHPWPGPFYRCW